MYIVCSIVVKSARASCICVAYSTAPRDSVLADEEEKKTNDWRDASTCRFALLRGISGPGLVPQVTATNFPPLPAEFLGQPSNSGQLLIIFPPLFFLPLWTRAYHEEAETPHASKSTVPIISK